MFTLFTFYRSDEWQKLIAALKQERTNSDGFLICEHCGKPILKPYDAIAHHLQELTEENVNDYSISLNPENLAFVHHACHNRIHDRFEHRTMRQVFIVYGAPLAGKSSWVKDNKADGDLVLDLDSIWEAVSGGDRYMKPARLKAVVFRIRDELLDITRHRLGKWRNAYIIGGYPLSNERERLAQELHARLVHIDTDKAECLRRLENDTTGRDKKEWAQYIEEYFDRLTPPG